MKPTDLHAQDATPICLTEQHKLTIPIAYAGQRLDQALAALLPHLSRNRIQDWIRDGLVWVNAAPCKPKTRLQGNEQVEICGTVIAQVSYQPQSIALDICYQDSDILVLNKPAGLVVHPAAGNPDGTMQNALLHWYPELIHVPRCGIVHRLDKDTSGLLVIARNLHSHVSLVTQLQAHTMHREYLAVVKGLPVAGNTIDLPIGRHPRYRTHMAVVANGKRAITHFRVQERFRHHSLLAVQLATGRTHQIRVHLAHIKFPILGDPVYGGRGYLPPGGVDSKLQDCLREFPRQALHATKLSLTHPSSGLIVSWEVALPIDMQQLIMQLRQAISS